MAKKVIYFDGKKLSDLRTDKKNNGENQLTQAKMAEKLSISRSSYNRLERSKENPSLGLLFVIAHYFKLPPEYFLINSSFEPSDPKTNITDIAKEISILCNLLKKPSRGVCYGRKQLNKNYRASLLIILEGLQTTLARLLLGPIPKNNDVTKKE